MPEVNTARSKTTPFRGRTIRKIAVLRALRLGDFLVAVPAFRALRQAFPEAEIDYVGLPWARELAARRFVRYFSGFVEFPGFPGLPEREWNAAEVTDFLARMQRRGYDLALQMHGNGDVVNYCVALWGAGAVAGFAPPGSFWLDNEWFLEYPEGRTETDRMLALMRHIGVGSRGAELEFPLMPEDWQELERLPEWRNLQGAYVCVHPGAVSSRPWPARNFAAVADACAESGLEVIITGTENELEIAKRTAQAMRHEAVVLTGKTSLGALAALLSRANLFVGNDTGTAHLAEAVGTSSLRVFTTSDPQRWRPAKSSAHRFVLPGRAEVEAALREARELISTTQGGSKAKGVKP